MCFCNFCVAVSWDTVQYTFRTELGDENTIVFYNYGSVNKLCDHWKPSISEQSPLFTSHFTSCCHNVFVLHPSATT
jgi:hypothetical protein